MGAVLDFSSKLESVECAACGVEFAFPMSTLKNRLEDGGNFFCPNGHINVFRETVAQRLKRDLEQAHARLAQERDRAERNWKALRQTSGKLAALRKRVKNGVCPCCKRTFRQLAQHMQSKHPEYVAARDEDLPEVVGEKRDGGQ